MDYLLLLYQLDESQLRSVRSRCCPNTTLSHLSESVELLTEVDVVQEDTAPCVPVLYQAPSLRHKLHQVTLQVVVVLCEKTGEKPLGYIQRHKKHPKLLW